MSLLNTLWRTVILDDAAYHEWRERPNILLRGILLILIVSLVAGLVSFAVNLVHEVQPVSAADIRQGIEDSLRMQEQFNPGFQDPAIRQTIDETMNVLIPMITDIVNIPSPLPRGVSGFFTALGGWLSTALGAIGGWLFYGALVLVAVNLMGGGAKLSEFYGMVAVYSIPGLLGLLSPVPCVGFLLALVGLIWGIVVYIKATAVVSGLSGGRATVAVFAPAVAILLLSLLLLFLFVIWMVILF